MSTLSICSGAMSLLMPMTSQRKMLSLRAVRNCVESRPRNPAPASEPPAEWVVEPGEGETSMLIQSPRRLAACAPRWPEYSRAAEIWSAQARHIQESRHGHDFAAPSRDAGADGQVTQDTVFVAALFAHFNR